MFIWDDAGTPALQQPYVRTRNCRGRTPACRQRVNHDGGHQIGTARQAAALRGRGIVSLGLAGILMFGNRIIGVVILAVGIVLVIFGMNASQAPLDQVSQTFTGRFTQTTMMYLIVGIVAVIGGGLLALSGRRT
jgi:hypothetical protein